jgi:hypothetical protein
MQFLMHARIGHAHGLEASTLNLDRWEGGGGRALKSGGS